MARLFKDNRSIIAKTAGDMVHLIWFAYSDAGGMKTMYSSV